MLTREVAATLIGAKVSDPNFGRDYLVGQIGLSFAGQEPETVDRITASKLVGVTGIATAADGRTALVEYQFTVGGGTPNKAEATFRLYDDGWRVDQTFTRLR